MNQPINRPAHRNTDSENTGVIKPVKIDKADQIMPAHPAPDDTSSRGPIPLVTLLAFIVLTGGISWATAISDLSQPVKIVVASVCVAAVLLLSSGGVTTRRSKL